MQRAALAATGLVASACGMSTPDGLGWQTVARRNTCEAVAPAFCQGGYGFSVDVSGRFTVGPAPDGTTLTGMLTGPERSQLDADAAAVARSLPTPQTCQPVDAIPGVTSALDLTPPGAGAVRVVELRGPGQLCVRGDGDAARRLDADVAGLEAEYYPRPFPR